jgi:hypothetical protein
MKNIFIILILLFFQNISSQIKDTSQVVVQNIKLSKKDYVDNQIKLYVDSLNFMPEKTSFIFNPCFDLNGSFWKNMHQPTDESIRLKIVQNIYKKSSIKKILKSNNRALKEKCNCQDSKNIPLINESFYTLFEKRYKELRKNRNAN